MYYFINVFYEPSAAIMMFTFRIFLHNASCISCSLKSSGITVVRLTIKSRFKRMFFSIIDNMSLLFTSKNKKKIEFYSILISSDSCYTFNDQI